MSTHHNFEAREDGPIRPRSSRRCSLPSIEQRIVSSVSESARSVVQIFSYSSQPDYGMPWQLGRQTQSTSSGFVILHKGKKIIVTNAHSVTYCTGCHVKKNGGSKKYPAKILYVEHSFDLAFLDCDDQLFWRDLNPLQIGTLPDLQSSVVCIGFPTGGDAISFTQGVVSRLGTTTYSHSQQSSLTIQIDAAINSGNSGGPALCRQNGESYVVVGVAFQSLQDGEGLGYCIPTPVLNHTLEAFDRGLNGTPSLNIITQTLEANAMRKKLSLPPLSAIVKHLYNCDDAGKLQQLIEPTTSGGTCDSDANAPMAATPLSSQRSIHEETVRHQQLALAELGIRPGSDTRMLKTAEINTYLDKNDQEVLKHKLGLLNCNGNDSPPNDDTASSSSSTISLKQLHDSQSSDSTRTKPKLHRSRSLVQVQLSREEDDFEVIRFTNVDETDLYDTGEQTFTIKKSDKLNTMPPLPLLHYLADQSNDDTTVGVCVSKIVPFSTTEAVLKPNDIILTISDIPISSDGTITLRGHERVSFSHIITSKHIGDSVEMIIVRDNQIRRVHVPVSQKEYIAKWASFDAPSYLVCLGLVFCVLTSALMQSEHGDSWQQFGEIPLLSDLFNGTMTRRSADEEVVVLTQILSHPCNDGYDYSMYRVTHCNGIRIVNLAHLASLVHNAAEQYERLTATRASSTEVEVPSIIEEGAEDDIATPSSVSPSSVDDYSQELVPRKRTTPPGRDPDHDEDKDDGDKSPCRARHTDPMLSRRRQYSTTMNDQVNTITMADDAELDDLPSGSDDDHDSSILNPSSATTHEKERREYNRQRPGMSIAGVPTTNQDQRKGIPVTIPDDSKTYDSKTPLHTPLLNTNTENRVEDDNLAEFRYLTFVLSNGHQIILDLESGEHNHLEILEKHQIPVPGSSRDLVPMYSVQSLVVSPASGLLVSPSPTPTGQNMKMHVRGGTPQAQPRENSPFSFRILSPRQPANQPVPTPASANKPPSSRVPFQPVISPTDVPTPPPFHKQQSEDTILSNNNKIKVRSVAPPHHISTGANSTRKSSKSQDDSTTTLQSFLSPGDHRQ